MDKIDITNLSGKCLISQPSVDDDFAGSVIYICSHNTDGAMGFVINKRFRDISFSELTAELPFNFNNLTSPISLYNGGPLERAKGFILHSNDYSLHDSLSVGGGITVSSSLEVLRDIAAGNGPKQLIIALGYAGWAPQQLENEIAANRWLVTNASPELVLSDNEDKWTHAMSSLGLDFNNFSLYCGRS